MARIAKLEVKIEIKSSPEKFYGVFRNNITSIVNIAPQTVKSCDLLEGEEGSCVGSVHLWNYVLGSTTTLKTKIEAIDDENNAITFTALDGDVLKIYKSLSIQVQAMKESNGVSWAKWCFEYEKAYPEAPNADNICGELITKVAQLLDAYLLEH